jgi:lysophospholipase L1-like esterase
MNEDPVSLYSNHDPSTARHLNCLSLFVPSVILCLMFVGAVPGRAEGKAVIPARVVCFGDSITDGDTYPQILAQAFREAGDGTPAFICSGVGGETAAQMDVRFDQTVGIFKPDLITILEGTNDAFANTSADEYGKSMRSIVAKAKAIGAKVMLLTPPECLARPGKTEDEKAKAYARIQKDIDSYESVIRTIAAESGCLLADDRKLMKDSLKAGHILFVEDQTHPNYLGQSLIARSILDALGDQEIALPKTFDPKPLPGLVEKWQLRRSPLDAKGHPIRLTADDVSKLAADGTWTPFDVTQSQPLADSPEIWLEQMRRNGAGMNLDKLLEKNGMAQGMAEVTSVDGGPAYIQNGMQIKTIWLNGVLVHDQVQNQKEVWRGVHAGKERIPVNLKKGVNEIVIEFNGNFLLLVTHDLIWENQLR